MRVFRKRDLAIVFFILAVAIFTTLERRPLKPEKVIVMVDGKVVMEIDKPGEYPVYREGRRITTVVFDGNKVRVKDSTCPLKICEKMGWVGPGGEIICVPNRLVVRMEGSEMDAVTW